MGPLVAKHDIASLRAGRNCGQAFKATLYYYRKGDEGPESLGIFTNRVRPGARTQTHQWPCLLQDRAGAGRGRGQLTQVQPVWEPRSSEPSSHPASGSRAPAVPQGGRQPGSTPGCLGARGGGGELRRPCALLVHATVQHQLVVGPAFLVTLHSAAASPYYWPTWGPRPEGTAMGVFRDSPLSWERPGKRFTRPGFPEPSGWLCCRSRPLPAPPCRSTTRRCRCCPPGPAAAALHLSAWPPCPWWPAARPGRW